jgi:hypothetical protein
LARAAGGAMRPARPVHLLVGIAAIGAAAAAFFVAIEAVLSPWARSLTGGPTLTGEWLGEMTTPTGRIELVWVAIEHAVPSDSCFGCPTIEGRVATCDAPGAIHAYEMWGGVDSWDGTAFHLKTREMEESPVRLLFLEGRWSGDEIELTTTLVAPGVPQTMRVEKTATGGETTTVVDGHPDTRAPVEFSLKRGSEDEFKARCRGEQAHRVPNAAGGRR